MNTLYVYQFFLKKCFFLFAIFSLLILFCLLWSLCSSSVSFDSTMLLIPVQILCFKLCIFFASFMSKQKRSWRGTFYCEPVPKKNRWTCLHKCVYSIPVYEIAKIPLEPNGSRKHAFLQHAHHGFVDIVKCLSIYSSKCWVKSMCFTCVRACARSWNILQSTGRQFNVFISFVTVISFT